MQGVTQRRLKEPADNKKPHFRFGNVRWRKVCFGRAAHSIEHTDNINGKRKTAKRMKEIRFRETTIKPRESCQTDLGELAMTYPPHQHHADALTVFSTT